MHVDSVEYLFFLNKYYSSLLCKSFFLFTYSRKYFEIIKNYPLILAVNTFHKQKLVELGIKQEKVKIFYNPINFQTYSDINKVIQLFMQKNF